MVVDHTEKGFEENIESCLLDSGYIKGNPKDFDKVYALNPKELFLFLEATQEKDMNKLRDIYKDQTEVNIIKRLNREIEQQGILHVLKHGIKDRGVYLKLAYPKPVNDLNYTTLEKYSKNRFTMTRQVHYSTKNPKDSLDMVISLNGLPIAILELKNQFTDQTVIDAMEQFREDRDPNELLFRFNKKSGNQRAIVYFAVDTDETYMTTRLNGAKTFFLPFNKGFEGGKGNPPGKSYRTEYLWESTLQKDSLIDILFNFCFIEEEEKELEDGKTITDIKLIFPRYHQLDGVRKLIANSRIKGAGTNYLIQHSAGSGKTKSISWLTHRLAKLHDENDNPVFNKIIVITDRTVLDKQLQEAIGQLEHKKGFVGIIDKDSTQLKEQLESSAKIIVSTLQKFPFVLEKISDLGDKKYAVVVDEAHSSQTGKSKQALQKALSFETLEEAEEFDRQEELEEDEKILKEIEKIGKRDNISYFAFTATPKHKTLELFGTYDKESKPHPFHVYSMRQAIEEGFILDVLKNYVTYDTCYQIAKKIKEDPEYKERKATREIMSFLTLHPHNIAQKTHIIIEHFRQVTQHKIGGKGKAMLVTSSRMQAVKYKLAFDKYIKEHGYEDIKTLVAFSGKIKDPDTEFEYTEPSMNNFGEKELPKKFKTDEYQILLVANKYQTGFDQPLLHTMYVDKKLSGVKAVQTLSRLNRTCKGKVDTFVLDFVNTAEDIKKAFQPFYEVTEVEDVTDPNLLYDIQNKLDNYRVYAYEEIDKFYKVLNKKGKKTSKDQGLLNSIIDEAVERFKNIEKEEDKKEFRASGNKFVKLYAFILQIGPFADTTLHKLYFYLVFLLKKLPRNTGESVYLGDELILEYYKNDKTFNGSISLNKGEGEKLKPMTSTGGIAEEKEEYLSSIIDKINERFGTDFTETDKLSFDQIKEDCINDEDLMKKAKNNNIDNFKLSLDKVFQSKVVKRFAQNQEFFTKILNNKDFSEMLKELMVVELYEKMRD